MLMMMTMMHKNPSFYILDVRLFFFLIFSLQQVHPVFVHPFVETVFRFLSLILAFHLYSPTFHILYCFL